MDQSVAPRHTLPPLVFDADDCAESGCSTDADGDFTRLDGCSLNSAWAWMPKIGPR
jgi:hypothetical protein